MMKVKVFFLSIMTFVLAVNAALHAEAPLPFNLQESHPTNIVINNRILVKVNGKPITVVDVVKKMDYLFYRQYPELANSIEARYQFYTTNWRSILSTVINDQLTVADAKEKKIEVTDGDVRETLEELFGPDVVINIDKLGLSYEETWDLLKTELIVRRMVQVMVRGKAMQEVYPKEVKKLYEKFVQENPSETQWVYQMLTIQPEESEKGSSLANVTHELLVNQNVALSAIPDILKEKGEIAEVRVSEEYKRSDKELSQAHKEVLQNLGVGCFSAPIAQKSKTAKEAYRIFYLKEKQEAKKLAFSEMSEKLQSKLTSQAMTKYNEEYAAKLREHYGITDAYLKQTIPANFQPFALR